MVDFTLWDILRNLIIAAQWTVLLSLIAFVGGTSAAALFLLFPLVNDFRPILYGLVLLIGFLVGLEIPLLIRILKDEFSFGDLVSNVLTYDYIGALAASLRTKRESWERIDQRLLPHHQPLERCFS